MISKEEYIQAKEIIKKYDEQMTLTEKCWIIKNNNTKVLLVTTDFEYANRLYDTSNYTLLEAHFIGSPDE